MIKSRYIKKESLTHSLICGAGNGIGLAMVKNLLEASSESTVFATYREPLKSQGLLDLQKQHPGRLYPFILDVAKASDFAELESSITMHTQTLDLVIHTIGFLHDDEVMPEKSIKDINLDQMQKSFLINSTSVALLAKSIFKLIKNKQPSIFAALSARVGSIGDNRSGGWYSYRASKAALNMTIKNLSLEFDRSSMSCVAAAVHPGTVKTKLSEPFTSRTKYQLHTPDEAADHILKAICDLDKSDQGMFLDWQGEKVQW